MLQERLFVGNKPVPIRGLPIDWSPGHGRKQKRVGKILNQLMFMSRRRTRKRNYGDENLVVREARVHDLLVWIRQKSEFDFAVNNRSGKAARCISRCL